MTGYMIIIRSRKRRIGDLLRWLGVEKLHLNIPIWVWLAIGIAAVTAIIVWPIRGGLSRGVDAPHAARLSS